MWRTKIDFCFLEKSNIYHLCSLEDTATESEESGFISSQVVPKSIKFNPKIILLKAFLIEV